jgi:hypothetical protein
MSMVDNIFAQAAQQQCDFYNRIAEYKEKEAVYDLVAAKQIQENTLLIKRNIEQHLRPSMTLQIALMRSPDSEWIAAYGDCQAAGPTPDLACQAFDILWTKGSDTQLGELT